MSWYCYIIKSTDPNNINKSYNGSTNNPIRRLRQHNGEITGGAYRTKIGRPWIYYALLKGLPNHINTLQCEYAIRYPLSKKKKLPKYKGICGRIVGLNDTLKLDKWTKNSNIYNKDIKLELWVLKEYINLIDNLPENITLYVVDEIDPYKIHKDKQDS